MYQLKKVNNCSSWKTFFVIYFQTMQKKPIWIQGYLITNNVNEDFVASF